MILCHDIFGNRWVEKMRPKKDAFLPATAQICAGLCVCALSACVLFQPSAALAQKRINRLSEKAVREFIEETAQVIQRQGRYAAEERVKAYLDRHLHGKSLFQSKMKYVIPGFPSQTNMMSLDKAQFIESVVGKNVAVDSYKADVRILSVNLSADKSKASVVTENNENGMMNVNGGESGKTAVPVNGHSKCDQVLVLQDGIIRMYSAVCKTTVQFEPVF